MKSNSMSLVFEVPEGASPFDVLQAIAEDEDQDSSGYARVAGQDLSWRLRQPGDGVEIDRRQRLAAAALLMGFDLPQEMMAASVTMLEAADVCPGMTTGDLAPMGPQGRRQALKMARSLIDEMLDEIK